MKNLIFIITLLLSASLFAQNNITLQKKEFITAKKLIEKGDYNTAKKHLKEIYKYNRASNNISYLIGLCYLHQEANKNEAIHYLQYAVKSTRKNYDSKAYNYKHAPEEAYLLLAKAYYYDNRFYKALSVLSRYYKLDNANKLKKEAVTFKTQCLNAIKIINNPIGVIYNNVGSNINSFSKDFIPLLNANETVMVFTSNRDGINQIYISNKVNKKWEKAKKISSLINSSGNIQAVALSSDGSQLVVRKNDTGVDNLYISRNFGEWTALEKLGNGINSKYNETNASFSPDGSKLYFVSDRKGSFGGKDIYFSKLLPNGNWSTAKNIGNKINTKYNEDGVFAHTDGYTIYFSSEGYNSLGGYDLYFSDLINDSTWSVPTNMGYPLNTVYNDVNFTISTNGEIAYFSTQRDNTKGLTDIYKVNLLSSPKRTSVVVKGFVKNKSGDIVNDENVRITERKSNKEIGIYKPNNNGEYTFILRQGLKYFISFDDKTKIYSPKMFEVPSNSSFYEIGKPIIVETLTVIE